MSDFDPIHVDFLLNQAEVKKNTAEIKKDITGADASAQRSAQKMGETVKRVYDQNVKEVNEYTAAVTKSKAALRANTAMVGKSASGFNTLNHSINQISRELPAFAVSAQIGILALSNNIPILADEINKLKVQNQQLVASGQKGVPVWKSLARGIFGWQTLLSLGITLITVYGREIGKFFSNLSKGKSTIDAAKESQEALNQAFESTDYKKAVKNVLSLQTNIELAKDGMMDAADVVDQYNKSMGKAVGTAKDLNEVEQLLVKNSNNYIQMMLYKAAANLALDKAAQDALESAQKQMKLEDELERVREKIRAKEAAGDTALSVGRGGASEFALLLKDRSVLEAELSKMKRDGEKAINERNRIFKALQEKAASFGLDIFLNDGGGGKKAVSNRQALLDKIAAIDREYARKRLSSDDAEIQALKDKFARIRELVERFNSDPNNKDAAIALGGLDASERRALADLRYRQDTKALAFSIREQRDIYREYESFRTRHGKSAADARFKNELEAFKTYSDFLQSKLDENKEALDAVASGNASGSQRERVDLLRAAANDEAAVEQRKFDDLVARLLTYQEKMLKIEEQYLEKEKQLREQFAGADLEKRIEVLKHQKDEELKALNEAAFKESELYADLNERILGMTRRQIKQHLAVLVNALNNGFFRAADGTMFRFSQAQISELKSTIHELDELLNETRPLLIGSEKMARLFEDMGRGFSDLAFGIHDMNPELAESVQHMAELAEVGASTAKALSGFARGDIIGGISSSLSAIGNLFGLFGGSKRAREERERKIREAQEEFQVNVLRGEFAINEVLRERLLLRSEEISLTLQQMDANRQALEANSAEVESEFERLRNELNDENYIFRINASGNPTFAQINETHSFDYLRELYEGGRLEGRALEIFEQLLRLQEEGEDIEAQLAALRDQAQQIFTGTTQESIADGIINGLRQGKTAVEDFAGDMEELLQNAILNSIKYQTLEEPLADFYEQFAAFAESDGALTESEIAELRALYESIVGQAIESFDALSGILDQDLLGGAESGLKGAIKRELTEETASELTGLYRATFDVMKRTELAIQSQLEIERKTFDRTHKIMKSSAAIAENTSNTVDELKIVVKELRTIRKNTRDNSTGYDKGL